MNRTISMFCTAAFFLIIATSSAHAQENEAMLQTEFHNAISADSQSTSNDFNTAAQNAQDRQLFTAGSNIAANASNPAISFILDVAGAYFSEDEHYRQGGHAPHKNGPVIQGAELGISTSIDPYFRVDVAFGMAHLHLEEAYLTTTALPWNLQARAGKYKAKIGRHNPTHLHSWSFISQPLSNEWLFGAEGLSLPGLELSWLMPLPWYVECIGSVQLGSSGSFRSKSISEGEPSFSDFLYPLRIEQFFDVSTDVSLQLGMNAVFGTSDMGPENGNRSYAYGIDWVVKWRPIGEGTNGYSSLKWETEAWFRQMEVPNEVWNDIGGYSAFVVGINKRWEAAFRTEIWHQLTDTENVSRYLYGVTSFKQSLSVSFLPSHFSRVRLQHNIETIDSYPTVHSTFIQMEVSGGAHASHGF